MRGCVFLEKPLSENETGSLPPVCVSGDTSRFPYTCRNGLRSAIRVARVVLETVALDLSDVRWFVFGDDDTVFFPENLVKTLSKYDHRIWYYIGSNSEIYIQNKIFSFGMAFGGGGFAISYPLARVLAKVLDSCLERYPHLYGSDGRVYSCISELGVGLTKEPGFHQMDVHGNIFGLLAAHPNTPLLSLHHLDHTDPIFPNMTTTGALEHLLEASKTDPHRLLQRTICYNRRFSWTISVSWGYAVQIFDTHLLLPVVLRTQQTFRPWKKNPKNVLEESFYLDTKELHPDLCRRPSVFFFDGVSDHWRGDRIKSVYRRMTWENCTFDARSPRKIEEVRVFSHKMELDTVQLQAPRRHCCDVMPSLAANVMEIGIRECEEEELVHM